MKYLAAFASSSSLVGFRLAEFVAVAATLRIPIAILDDSIPWLCQGGDSTWFSVFESPASAEELTELAARCMLLRGFYILFETTPTLEELYTCLDARHSASPSASMTVASISAPFFAFIGPAAASAEEAESSTSYGYQVETIGKKYTAEAKRAVLEAVRRRVPLKGEVDFRAPQRRYFVFLQHAVEQAPPGAQGFVSDGPLLRVFHCRLCVDSKRSALLATYDLKRRLYIGTTSMPPEESALMANMAHVRRGQWVYDPFCGTGSLLVAAAHCGAHTFGSDADGRAMRSGTAKGWTSPQMQQQRALSLATYSAAQLERLTPEERVLPTMWSNFKVYGLPLPDLARMNFSAWTHTWHTAGKSSSSSIPSTGIFDAIVTDPPYGLREPRKKVEAAVGTRTITTTNGTDIGPGPLSLSAYDTGEVVLDLVMFAATRLVVGGRLAFWHPTSDHYTDDELPTHPCMQVVSNIPQRVSLKVVRRLVVMEKTSALPIPPPSQESCAPRKAPDDLRVLMDATVLPDNVDYAQYRAKRERKRQAAAEYNRTRKEQKGGTEGEGERVHSLTGTTPSRGNRRGRKANRVEGQEAIVANRQRNIEVRAAKQAASHLANAAHKEEEKDGEELAPQSG